MANSQDTTRRAFLAGALALAASGACPATAEPALTPGARSLLEAIITIGRHAQYIGMAGVLDLRGEPRVHCVDLDQASAPPPGAVILDDNLLAAAEAFLAAN